MDRTDRLSALRRRLLVAAVVAVLGLAFAACGGDDQKLTAPTATVHMGEFFYKPAELTVARNSALTVVNDGSVVHTWIVKGAGVGTADLAPGRSIIVDLKGIAPGTYQVYCDQPGHTQSGQTGTLTIT